MFVPSMTTLVVLLFLSFQMVVVTGEGSDGVVVARSSDPTIGSDSHSDTTTDTGPPTDLHHDRSIHDHDKEPSMCVSLALFKDQKCEQEHPFEVSFSTWSVPGSPCILPNPVVGVSDQFCGPLFYSQTVKLGKCDHPFRSVSQVLLKHVCEFGVKMVSCMPGKCDRGPHGTDGQYIEVDGAEGLGLLQERLLAGMNVTSAMKNEKVERSLLRGN